MDEPLRYVGSPPDVIPAGEKGYFLFAATEVLILGTKSDTARTMYQVEFADGKKMLAGLDEVVRSNDPLFLFVQDCKLYMEDLGYRGLALGTDKDLYWRPFYFNEPDEYSRLAMTRRDIHFRYYWALNR